MFKKIVIPNALKLVCAGLLFAPMAQAYDQVCFTDPNLPKTAPDSRFIEHNDGTVTDIQTGLMWKKCLEGFEGDDCLLIPNGDPEQEPDDSVMTWSEALIQAKNSQFAGYSWRLPNVNELGSIVEFSCYSQAINQNVFPYDPEFGHFPPDDVWSASPVIAKDGTTGYAWQVEFGNGYIDHTGKTNALYVRLVRGGHTHHHK